MFFLAGQAAYARRFDKEICLTHPFDSVFKVPFRLCTRDEIQKASQQSCFFPRFSSAVLEDAHCLMLKNGYLQDERFFMDQKDFVKNLFQFNISLPPNVSDLVKSIEEKNSVSIHIRRGDYIRENRPIMSLKYYERGADYIQSKTKDPIHLFVFSDDIQWVKDHFKSKYPFTIVEGNSDVTDMYLMTLCHHNIIANSTFSWWGAYLNAHQDKIVIAPDAWDRDKKWWGQDIILKDWIVLESDAFYGQTLLPFPKD